MGQLFRLIVGSHNHLPYGVEDSEYERLYAEKLKPFISTLNQYPAIPAVLHYSGVLLQWIERIHPEFFMLIVDMVSRKQVELLGGGFYEPLLPLLPQADKIGQIEMLTTYLRKQFGKRPQGCWLPALAWEQPLTGILNACGMGYTFLKEEQFITAGFRGSALYRPCISEDQGKLVTIFPLSSRISAAFAHHRAADVLERTAGEIPAGEERLVSVFPERFFTNHDGQGIHQFFEDLTRCASFVEFTSPGKLVKGLRGLDRAYFPSSAEGGEEGPLSPPRRFLVHSPEINGIYAKMMYTHVLINQLRGDKSRKRTAREELWKAQGYDVFWATGNGGISHNGVRNGVYRALLGAEKITREKGIFIPSLMALDFDLDGEEEYLFQEELINCYIKTRGASIFEFDFLPKNWNYLSTLAPDASEGAAEGSNRRTAFADYLVSPDFSYQDALAGRFGGSRRCAGEWYEPEEIDRPRERARFRLPPKTGGPFDSIEIEKVFHLKKNVLIVRYILSNRGDRPKGFGFIPVIDLAFPGEGENFQRLYRCGADTRELVPAAGGAVWESRSLEFWDLKNEVILHLSADQSFDAWILPIRIPCRINGQDLDRYQSTCIMPIKVLDLEPGASWETEYHLQITY